MPTDLVARLIERANRIERLALVARLIDPFDAMFFSSHCHHSPLHYQKAALRPTASSPARHVETKSGISAPHNFRIDVGVMPLTRPDAISNCVRLSYEVAAFVFLSFLITEDGAIDTNLS